MSHADAVILRSMMALEGWITPGLVCKRPGHWPEIEDVLDTMDSLGNVDLAEETDRQEALEDA